MGKSSKAMRPIDKPLYGYWRAILLSWYSPSLYLDVGKRWKGFGLLYLAFFLFVALLPLSARLTFDFNRYFNRYYAEPIKNIPLLSIQQGEVNFSKPMPYQVTNKAGEVVLLIDTNQKEPTLDPKYPHLMILIMKNQLLYRLPPASLFFNYQPENEQGAWYLQPLSPKMNDQFDGKKWVNSSLFSHVKGLFAVVLYPSLVLFFYVFLSLFFLGFALMAQLVARVLLKTSLRYIQACRLLVVSSTPALMLLIGLLTCNCIFPYLGVVLMILLSIYFSFGVIAFRRYASQLVKP